MIEINNIITAIQQQEALFYDGAVMSYDACEFLLLQNGKVFDLLFSSFPKWNSQHKPHACICCKCQVCDEPYHINVTKTNLKKSNMQLLNYKALELSNMQENEIYNLIRIINPEHNLLHLSQVCKGCVMNFYKTLKAEADDFYKNPLIWVNTHTPNKHPWHWDRVIKLYAYPYGFDNQPEGWKYCGVRYKRLDSKSVSDMFETNYYNWKTINENTRVEWTFSSVHEAIRNLMGDKMMSPSMSLAHKRTLALAEQMLEALKSDADIQPILKLVAQETNKILDNYKKLSLTSRIFSFGKYKGMSIIDIIEIDPEYINWALHKIEGFYLTEEERALYNGEEWEEKIDFPIINNENEK